MTLRSKLNLAFTALIAIFLLTAGFAMRAVHENSALGQAHSRMRELEELTAGIHSGLYRHLSNSRNVTGTPAELDQTGWIHYALRDIDIQLQLAQSDEERGLWENLRGAMNTFEPSAPQFPSLSMDEAIRMADRSIRSLSSMYRQGEYISVAQAEAKNLRARQVIWISGSLTLLLLGIYVIMVRNSLVEPIEVLKSAADAIGKGELQRQIPLKGGDELAQLARQLETMAAHLSAHQAALLKARELSAIGDVCMHVAHGLRNPLAALHSIVQPTKTRGASIEQLTIAIHEVIRQADRLDDRVAKLIEFSQSRELHLDRATFRQIALTVKAHVQPRLKESLVELTVEDCTDDTKWHLDRDELAEALVELISNAVNKTAPSGTVILRSEALDNSAESEPILRIQIIDQGGGMSQAELDQAFDPFFTSRPDGIGMGLAIARRKVERMNGEITLTSDPGHGTTATILISGIPDFAG